MQRFGNCDRKRERSWSTMSANGTTSGRGPRRIGAGGRSGGEGLDPGVLTLGFARRFATYKRPTLLLHDPGPSSANPVSISSDRSN